MAIRGKQHIPHDRGIVPQYFAATSLAGSERGYALVLDDPTSGSGDPGDSDNKVKLATGASGEVFVGVLFDDVLDWDRTEYCFLPEKYRNATTVCRPVNVVREGSLRTNALATGVTPTAGKNAYLTSGGKFTTAVTGAGVVGKFRGTKDADGFVLIEFQA